MHSPPSTPCFPPPQYNNLQEKDACAACPVGRFQDVPGQPSCAPCAAGSSTDGLTGATACAPCNVQLRSSAVRSVRGWDCLSMCVTDCYLHTWKSFPSVPRPDWVLRRVLGLGDVLQVLCGPVAVANGAVLLRGLHAGPFLRGRGPDALRPLPYVALLSDSVF